MRAALCFRFLSSGDPQIRARGPLLLLVHGCDFFDGYAELHDQGFLRFSKCLNIEAAFDDLEAMLRTRYISDDNWQGVPVA